MGQEAQGAHRVHGGHPAATPRVGAGGGSRGRGAARHHQPRDGPFKGAHRDQAAAAHLQEPARGEAEADPAAGANRQGRPRKKGRRELGQSLRGHRGIEERARLPRGCLASHPGHEDVRVPAGGKYEGLDPLPAAVNRRPGAVPGGARPGASEAASAACRPGTDHGWGGGCRLHAWGAAATHGHGANLQRCERNDLLSAAAGHASRAVRLPHRHHARPLPLSGPAPGCCR
mmetsp:Transcript_86741/g.230477  ORF Transcript_86741/g.230477 Transcript_86741/m.230477 type:complete len:230 (+) Transcript_86741:266-955(+)